MKVRKQKNNKLLIFFMIIIIFICMIILLKTIIKQSIELKSINDNMSTTIKAVVVKISDSYFWVFSPDTNVEVCNISKKYAEEIELKEGQEILIHFSGWFRDMTPINIGNIEVIKDESNIEVPKEILRYLYSSKEKVSVSINEFTKEKLSITITDTNEIPFDYSNESIEIYSPDNSEIKFELTENQSYIEENSITKEYNFGKIYQTLEERKI